MKFKYGSDMFNEECTVMSELTGTRSVKWTPNFEDSTKKKGKYLINNFLYWLHVKIIIFNMVD